MKDKIIVWLDSNLTQYCACYYLQKEIDADFYAIIDVTNKTRTFFENQNLVNFKKIWFFHDNYDNKKTIPDLEYLKKFDEKYNMDLWKCTFFVALEKQVLFLHWKFNWGLCKKSNFLHWKYNGDLGTNMF